MRAVGLVAWLLCLAEMASCRGGSAPKPPWADGGMDVGGDTATGSDIGKEDSGGSAGADGGGGLEEAGDPGGEAGGDGSGGAAWPLCGGFLSASMREYCVGLDRLRLSHPGVGTADGGARSVQAGGRASIEVLLSNTDVVAHEYPCVGLLSERTDVKVVQPNPEWSLFAIGAGESIAVPAGMVDIPGSIPPGTKLHFQAWVSIKNADCAGHVLQFDLSVR
jgi:hypothetical protein